MINFFYLIINNSASDKNHEFYMIDKGCSLIVKDGKPKYYPVNLLKKV